MPEHEGLSAEGIGRVHTTEKEIKMTNSHTLHKRVVMIASAGLITLLAGCATAAPTSDTADAKSSMSMADKTALRAECQTMHDSMMAGKAMGAMPGHKMMSPEMMEKHQTCMEVMPEMKAQMQEKCAAHKADTMDHKQMGKGMMNHDQRGQHCAMMQSSDTDDGADQ